MAKAMKVGILSDTHDLLRPEVMDALRENGYDRLFNLEIPGERHCPIEIRRAKLIYCRALCEYLLG